MIDSWVNHLRGLAGLVLQSHYAQAIYLKYEYLINLVMDNIYPVHLQYTNQPLSSTLVLLFQTLRPLYTPLAIPAPLCLKHTSSNEGTVVLLMDIGYLYL